MGGGAAGQKEPALKQSGLQQIVDESEGLLLRQVDFAGFDYLLAIDFFELPFDGDVGSARANVLVEFLGDIVVLNKIGRVLAIFLHGDGHLAGFGFPERAFGALALTLERLVFGRNADSKRDQSGCSQCFK
jgi:hypothetical protein